MFTKNGLATIVATALTVTLASAPVALARGGVPAVKTKRIASGLSLPTFATHAPGDPSRLFVLEKKGVIKIIDLATNTVLATPFLNIDPLVIGGSSVNDEQGLLGLAFHPDYATNGLFWVYYTANATQWNTVARYKVSGSDPNVADPASGLVVINWSDPFSNHNGGWMDFGPDGYLYIAVGDGGSANDPGNRAQTIVNMKLGKILRIAPDVVDAVLPHYANPSDNPFVGITGDDEIWSYGVRNPWRCSFDRETGDFWIGDVGQGAVEEINFQPAGAPGGRNYGWRCKEGNTCTGLTGCTCSSPTLTNPIHTYTHATGLSITGGYVYRGCAYPELAGTYFFADYGINRVWSFRYDGTTVTDFTDRLPQITPSIDGFVVNQIASFGEDAKGEVYIVDHGSATTGQIFKIIPAAGEVVCVPPPPPCPSDLNADAMVDAADLAILLGAWGGLGADLNADGMTDAADLAILLGAWGACPTR
ncbi:MAG: PQQ-dependent sugar dehydrogenase [Phycisphaerae bacterium]|nr:PQQ-dependent sugar dehydrogenase [Phycisphaerae bacterium]